MQDNSGLYFIVGAIVVIVGAIAFYQYNGGGLSSSGPSVVERNTTIVNPPTEHTTYVNPPAENHTTIINPPPRERPTNLNIDIDTDNDRR